MKACFVFGLLATFFAGGFACSGGHDADAPPPSEGPPAEGGAPTDDGGSCPATLANPTCTSTTPPPTDQAAIDAFVKEGAVPLRCGEGDDVAWNLRPLIDLYGSQKMFMMGEIHGQNETGIMSSVLLKELATKGLVNVVGFEFPMDAEPYFQRYVDKGSDDYVESILSGTEKNAFDKLLTETARELATKGIRLRIALVDLPYYPETARRAIVDVAGKLTAHRDTVLATLPEVPNGPPSDAVVESVNTYYDHIMSSKAAVCSELSVDDCDRLDAMTHALWSSTMIASSAQPNRTWLERREVVIYYNLRSKMKTAEDRMFLHMGGAHTSKSAHGFSAGSKMAHEYALTKGQVFSVAPAFGDGSVVWYNGVESKLPGEPRTVLSALTNSPEHPLFVSTTRPSAQCEENPFGKEADSVSGGTRAEGYDGYIHFGRLTSLQDPDDTALSRDIPTIARELRVFRARVE